ncbi:MAG: response regulator transcription factor [Chloroflexota bacterium]
MPIRIFIADDSDLTIRGAVAVLETDHRLRVVGTARGMDDLLTALEQVAADVVLLNEWLYNTDVLNAVEQVRAAAPLTRLIVMGSLSDGLLIRDLFAVGVGGYLFKSDDLETHLITAVDTVMRDRPYLSPTANAEYLVAMQSPQRDCYLDGEARQVLRMLANGAHVGEISRELAISVRRVYWVRQKLRDRFGATTNEHMISRAAQEGFIFPAD